MSLVSKADKVPYVLFISLILQNDYSFEGKFLFSADNLRIPDLLTLLSLCLGMRLSLTL